MKRLSAILLTSLLLFLVCNIVVVKGEQDNYLQDFEGYPIGDTSGGDDVMDFDLLNGAEITDAQAHSGSKSIKFATNSTTFKTYAYFNFTGNVHISSISYYIRIQKGWEKALFYFYSGDTNFITVELRSAGYVYVGDTEIGTTSLYHWRMIKIVQNISAEGYDVYVGGSMKTVTGNVFIRDLTLTQIKIDYRSSTSSGTATMYFDDLNVGMRTVEAIPDYSDKWLHFGNVDTSTFYSIKDYKYCEAKRNIPMNIIVKRIEIAFDENQNLTSTDDLILYFSGTYLGHPDNITKYHATYNDVYLAEWTDLNLYLNDAYPVIELKSNKEENGYYWKGLGVFSSDVDNDGQKNTYFHDMDDVYGNGQAEGSTNILYDLAYRVWYVLQGYEVEDAIVCQKDAVQYYDTMAISYTANIEETTYLIIYNASDDEVYNTTLKSTQGKVFFTPTEDMGTGTYTASLVRNGTKVANDTFSVVEGNTQYAVWVDKNSVLPNEQFTIYYRLPEDEYGQIEILRGSTVVYSVDVEGSTNIQTLTYSNDNVGMYTIKLYRNVNGTLYLKDDEIVTIGEGYNINTISVNKTKLSEGDTVKIYGTHQYAGYNVYVLIQPGGLVYDVSNSNSFEINFKATQSADYMAYLMLDNQILDSISFTVAPAGTYEKNPLVSNFNYILAVAIIVIFAILGVAISNKAHITSSHKWFVTAIFVLIGLFICIIYNLIPLWIPFLVALVLVAYIIKEVL